MSESRRPAGIWRFGVFEADLDAGELRKNGMKIHLQGQPFHVLAVLLLHSGRLVRREQLRREVWPEDTFVEFDHALNTAVKKVRFCPWRRRHGASLCGDHFAAGVSIDWHC